MKPEDNMNIILVGKSHGKSRVLALNGTVAFVLALAVAALIAAAGWGGYSVALSQAVADKPSDSELVAEWQSKLGEQKAELAGLQQNVQDQVDALTLRLGEIQGRLLRLDALGQRFVESGLVGSDEFDFNQPAAVGGPEDSLSPPGGSWKTNCTWRAARSPGAGYLLVMVTVPIRLPESVPGMQALILRERTAAISSL